MSTYNFCPPVEYTLKIQYSRFSSACGYEYTVNTYAIKYDPYFDEMDKICLKSARLHCTIGESPTMYPKSDIVITPKTLHKLADFCEKIGNFWGCVFEKKLTDAQYYKMVSRLNGGVK